MTDPDTGWGGWQDANGDAMFIADGPKLPVLVRVTDNGENEQVLANFTSIDAAGSFQDWMNRSFEDTALANQRLSMARGGVVSSGWRRHPGVDLPGWDSPDDAVYESPRSGNNRPGLVEE